MTDSASRLLVVLQAQEAQPVETETSFAHRLAVALRQQSLLESGDALPGSRLGRWLRSLGLERQEFARKLVFLLIILSLAVGISASLQIQDVGNWEGSLLERLGAFIRERPARQPKNEAESRAGPIPTPTTPAEGTSELYGSGFNWDDRFDQVEAHREANNLKVLWPVSTIVSILTLGAWFLPRPIREDQSQGSGGGRWGH